MKLHGPLQRFHDGFLTRDVRLFARFNVNAPLLVVVALALLVNALQAAAAPFLYYYDSGAYVLSAYRIFFDGSFDTLGLHRVPGYPLFLAPILGVGGRHGMLLMAVAQHAIAVGTTAVVFKICEEMDRTRALAFVAGIFSAFSLQLQSYARLPMSELLYTFLCMLAIFYALRHLRSGGLRPFLIAIFLFSAATMARPGGKLLPVLLLCLPLAQMAFPRWRFLNPAGAVARWQGKIKFALLGGAIYGAVLGPWIVYNLRYHDYFGLVASLGLNLYSITVEYGIEGKNSVATADIRRRWNEYEAKRISRGEPPETRYTWRNHNPSFGHYLQATGLPINKADEIFLRAALDGIKAHPLTYVRSVVRSIYQTLMWAEPPYRYIQGVKEGDPRPGVMRYAMSTDLLDEAKVNLERIADRYFPGERNPIQWRDANVLTPVYVALSFAYHSIIVHGLPLLLVLVVGISVMIFLTIRENDIRWLVLLAYLGNTVVVSMLVVQAAPRHRLPADPVIDIGYGLAVVAFAVAVQWVWTKRQERGGFHAVVRNRLSSILPLPRALTERESARNWVLLTLAGYLAAMAVWANSKTFAVAFLIALLALLL